MAVEMYQIEKIFCSFEKLSNSYIELLDDKEDFNIIINAGESPNTKIFQAHSAILRYRSLYFCNELTKISKDKYDIKTLDLKNVSIQQFDIIIKYIYGGIFLLENHNASFIFELMLIAYEFLFDELAKYLETQLIENEAHAHWLRLNFTRIYQKIFQNNKLQELQKWSNDIVVKYPEKFFDSEEFNMIQENALISLISRDDLQMEEVKIWNRVIEWGIAQKPSLPSDSKNWTHENFLALKATLRNCLPHIRYFHISGDEIIDNVRPYQQILEKDLWDDITIKLISPNRQITSTILLPRKILRPTLPTRNTEPFSTVINEAHAAEIASWIDKKENTYSLTNNPYEFKLLLRGTRDGFNADSFWKLCDKQTQLVVVMKVKGTDEILGGYNPIGWDKSVNSSYRSCNDSFIFSLKNGTIQNSILSRVTIPEYAIYCYCYGGPKFGAGRDLGMSNCFNQDRKCWHTQSSYAKRIRNASTFESNGATYFSVEEYEIFQISKKF
ncbi:hypothetical protein C2G38_2140889 [Gigaspora rosea]|uniref:TLD-domain-containing protein n=1 Tax=Gigaspora rosea TaxID=44941 RepID=A0A397VET8_9GLOM|nr:hypothetical protein C2G38_2140889 [Gigaspora rosea]